MQATKARQDDYVDTSNSLFSADEDAWRELGNLIARRRNDLGHTVRQAASRIGVGTTTLNHIELGYKNRLKYATAHQFEDYLMWERGSFERFINDNVLPEIVEPPAPDPESLDDLNQRVYELETTVDELIKSLAKTQADFREFVDRVSSVVKLPAKR